MARRLDIQGLRAVAIALVLVFHTGRALPGGFSGVDVFFAISGFVIASTLVAELERTGGISLPRFYLRRTRRLLPALAVLVVFVALVGTLADPAAATHVSALTGVFASFFAANFYLDSLSTGYFSVSAQLDPLLHTWTLAVEEQFYLVFPALLLGGWWLGARWRRPRVGAALVVAAAAEASFVVAIRAADVAGSGSGYYGSPARAWEFGAGALTALAVPVWRRLHVGLALALVVAGGSGVLAVAVEANAQTSYLVPRLVPVASTCALLAAGCVPNRFSRVLGARPLTWLGDLSYSLYLWHWPLIVFAGALAPGVGWAVPAAAAASLLPAWLSYRFVENPIRHNPRIRGRVALALAAACVATPALVAFGTTRIPQLAGPKYAVGHHEDVTRGCAGWAAYGSAARSRCTWHTPDARGDVVLVGDSNAGHFTEPFVAAARADGYTATVATPSGCPLIPLEIESSQVDYTGCNRFNVGALRALVAARPSLVVLAARTDVYLARSDFALRGTAGSPVRDPAARARLWAHALGSEIGELNRAGIPVVVLHPVPEMPHSLDDCAVVLLITRHCGGSTSRAQADRDLHASLLVERAAASGRRAWVVSFEGELCTRSTCSSTRDGLVLYHDLDHLSVAGAMTLTGAFERRVLVHARGAHRPTRLLAAARG